MYADQFGREERDAYGHSPAQQRRLKYLADAFLSTLPNRNLNGVPNNMTDQTIDLTIGDSQELDFTDVSTTFKPRDPGTYAATLTKMEPKRAGTSGNPMLVAEFTFTDPAVKGKIWNNYVLIPNSLWRLKGDALTLGCDPDMFAGKIETGKIIEEMTNRPCALTINIDSYTNEAGETVERNRIVKVHAPDFLDDLPAAGKAKKKGGF